MFKNKAEQLHNLADGHKLNAEEEILLTSTLDEFTSACKASEGAITYRGSQSNLLKVVKDDSGGPVIRVNQPPGDPKPPERANQNAQQVLFHLKIHEATLALLRLPFENNLPQEQGLRNVFLAAYRFLTIIGTDFPPGQSELLGYVGFVMSQMGANLKAAATINEIFRENEVVVYY